MKKLLLLVVVFLVVMGAFVFASTADKPSVTAQDAPISASSLIISDVSSDYSSLVDTKGNDAFINTSYLNSLYPDFAEKVFQSLIKVSGAAIVKNSVTPERFDVLVLMKDAGLTIIPYAARTEAEEEVRTNLEMAYEELQAADNVEDLFAEEEEMTAPEGYEFSPVELFAYGFSVPVVEFMDDYEEKNEKHSYFVITITYEGIVTTPYVAVRTVEGEWLKGYVKKNENNTLTLYLPAEGSVLFLEAVVK